MPTSGADRAAGARAAGISPSVARRSRVEAGVLVLTIGGILAFAVGFAALFPDRGAETAAWRSWSDPTAVFTFRIPPGWALEPTPGGATVRQPGDGMSVAIARLDAAGTGVDRLTAQRIREVGDLGDAEAIDEPWRTVDGRPTAGLRELTWGDGRVTVHLFVQVENDTYVTITATASPAAFDEATLDDIVETIRVHAPDVVADGSGQPAP